MASACARAGYHSPDSRAKELQKRIPSTHKLRWVRRSILKEEGDENWLVSYADMMTLLFGFFVILATFSVPDPKRFEHFRKMASKAVNKEYESPHKEFADQIRNKLHQYNLDNQVEIEETAEGINLVSAGTYFFDSSSVELKPDALKIVELLGKMLAENATKYDVIVEGHTDDVPVATSHFPSNWELSSGRASRVVRLLEERGFPHSQLRPLGFADTVPVAPNRDETGEPIFENQGKNRRIVIRIRGTLNARNAPPAAKAPEMPSRSPAEEK